MKSLNSKAHGYLDFTILAALFLAPQMLGVTGTAATISYALGFVVAALVLITAYPFGLFKLIPFQVHGTIEALTAPFLLAAPWIFGFDGVSVERNYYLALGAILGIVWMLTDYKAVSLSVKSRAEMHLRPTHA
jgi:hypothetical protein